MAGYIEQMERIIPRLGNKTGYSKYRIFYIPQRIFKGVKNLGKTVRWGYW